MEQTYLQFAKNIAYKAGEIMLYYFKKDNVSEYKSDNTIVTLADKEINQYLIEQVKLHFPSHCVDGEEKQFGKSNYIWVCDPIDGTAMYARHIPIAVFSLALVVDGEPIVGVIYDPFTNNIYSAIKGKGAYRNDTKIQVSDISLNDMQSVSHYDMWPNSKSAYDIYPIIGELGKQTYFISIGSIAKACTCVATGEFNLAIFPGTKHKNCDLAAAKIIVEEAGGKVTDLFGHNQQYDGDINGAIISNGKVHDAVISLINKRITQTNYFDEYVFKYDMNDPDINYKYYHSYRVMEIMENLTTKLNMAKQDIELAKIIGLLHDIGRFEQDKLFNSFKDDKMDHADYGVEVLKKNNLLAKTSIAKEDYEVVYQAIKNHNKFQIEPNLNDRELLFAKLIRDADKLDILYALGNKHIKKELIQDNQEITEKLSKNFFSHQISNIREIKSKNDGLIITFCYIYDLNFKVTAQIIYENKYYDKIYQRIIRKDIFEKYLEYTNKYLKERID